MEVQEWWAVGWVWHQECPQREADQTVNWSRAEESDLMAVECPFQHLEGQHLGEWAVV